MIEFGSDYHNLNLSEKYYFPLADKYNLQYYSSGRTAINALLLEKKWKRIWMPKYFCYEVIRSIESTGIQVLFYSDYPMNDEKTILEYLPYKKDDVLFRVNYFGLSEYRSNSNIKVDVIEDHTHDLNSFWALNSDADYCIASLRKTLPLASGGALWSPLKYDLPSEPPIDSEYENMMSIRFSAMELKRQYLQGFNIDKSFFMDLYIKTEDVIDNLNISAMSQIDKNILLNLDIPKIYKSKQNNWDYLCDNIKKHKFLKSENSNGTNFSFIMSFDSIEERSFYKNKLIKESIYPAILWEIPNDNLERAETLLSIHCDFRYSLNDIKKLCEIINNI